MQNYNSKRPPIFDRLISAGSYLSGGLIGIIWFFISYFRKVSTSAFCQYHISQSIIFWLIIYIISLFFEIIFGLLQTIPFIGKIILNILLFFNTPIYNTFSITSAIISILTLYMVFGALIGSNSYVPYLSDLIRRR